MEKIPSLEAGSIIAPKGNLTSQRNVDICSDTTKPSEFQDLNTTVDVADIKLVSQDSILKSEALIASDHVKKKTSVDPQVCKVIPESLASSILEVSDVVGMDDSDVHQDLKSVPSAISQEEINIDIEPLQTAHHTSEVKGVQRTEHLKKQVRISEKALVDSEEGTLDAIREQMVETTDVLKPLVKPQPLKETASGMRIAKTSTLTVEEINQTEKEDLNRTMAKLPQENIKRKKSAQNAIVISDPAKLVDKIEPIETILTDDTKFAAKGFQSKENIAQEQLIPHVQESTSSTAMKIFDVGSNNPSSQGQFSLESNLHILHNNKDELTENEIPFQPTKSSSSIIPIHADVIDDSKDIKNSTLNKETIIVDSAGKVTMLDDGRDHSQSSSSSRASRSKDTSNVPSIGQETTPVETTIQINQDSKREHRRTRVHEGGSEFETRLEIEEIVEQNLVQELPNITHPTLGQPKLSHSGPDNAGPLVFSESISLGLIDEKALKEKAISNANQIPIENESRIEEIIQEIETVSDNIKKDNNQEKQEEDLVVAKAVPSRDASITRDDSRIMEVHEVKPLPIETKQEKRGARRSRDHSSHGINESVVETEVTSPLPKAPPRSRISRSRNSSNLPRMSQETTPLETTTTTSPSSKPSSFKREHSQPRIHEGDGLINKPKKSTSMYGLAVAKQSHSDKISEFEVKDRSPTIDDSPQLEKSANFFVENNIPHKVNKIDKVEGAPPTAVVVMSDQTGIFASPKLKHHDYLARQDESVQGTAKSLVSPMPDKKNSYQSLYLGPSNTLDLEVTDNLGTTAEMKQNITAEKVTVHPDSKNSLTASEVNDFSKAEHLKKRVRIREKASMDSEEGALEAITEQLVETTDVMKSLVKPQPSKEKATSSLIKKDSALTVEETHQSEREDFNRTLAEELNSKIPSCFQSEVRSEAIPTAVTGLLDASGNDTTMAEKTIVQPDSINSLKASEVNEFSNAEHIDKKSERKTRSASLTRKTRDVSASRIGQETTPFETTTKIQQENIKRENSQPRFHDTDGLKILPAVGGIDVHGFPKRLDDQPKQIQTLINVSPNLVFQEENIKHEGSTISNIEPISPLAPAAADIEPVQAILESTTNTITTNNANKLPTSKTKMIFKQPEVNICKNDSQQTPLNRMEEVFEVANIEASQKDLTSSNSEKANIDIIEAIVLHEAVTETPESHAPAAIIPVAKEEITNISPKKNVLRFLDVAKLSEETFLEDATAVIQDPHTLDEKLKSSSFSITQPLSDVINASVISHNDGVLPLDDNSSLISEKQKVATGKVNVVAQESHISKTTEATAFEEHDVLKVVPSTLPKSIATSNVAFNQESTIEDNSSQIQGCELSQNKQSNQDDHTQITKAKVKKQELLSDESSISSQSISSEAVKQITKADSFIPSTEKARMSQTSAHDSISHQNTLVLGSSKKQVIIIEITAGLEIFLKKIA